MTTLDWKNMSEKDKTEIVKKIMKAQALYQKSQTYSDIRVRNVSYNYTNAKDESQDIHSFDELYSPSTGERFAIAQYDSNGNIVQYQYQVAPGQMKNIDLRSYGNQDESAVNAELERFTRPTILTTPTEKQEYLQDKVNTNAKEKTSVRTNMQMACQRRTARG
jgi:hypothetical protein